MITVDISRLTMCEVVNNGHGVRLSGESETGETFDLNVPFEHVGTLAMTLPHLLNLAIRKQFRDPSLRYVFPLGGFAVEEAGGSNTILSLKTPDGFEVSFSVSASDLAALAQHCNPDAGGAAAPTPFH